MAMIGEWLRRLWYLLNRRRLEDVLEQEMDAHRAMMDDPGRFGNRLRLREQSRDIWGWMWLDNLLREVRFAIRALQRTPSFAGATILSLGLGLALTGITVSVLNAYLIRSLPYPDAHRLYHLTYAPPGPWEPAGMSGLDWKSVDDVVEHPIASSGDAATYFDGGSVLAARGVRVTHGFVEGLGVRVVQGRRLTQQDFQVGSERVALIGYGLWRDRFSSDLAAIGRVIRAEPESPTAPTVTYRIVGVLEPGFYFGRDSSARVDLLIPHTSALRAYMVRLRDGVPPAAAARRINEAARRAATTPIPDTWTGVRLESAHDRYVGSIRPVLAAMAIAVSLVLIIVCANVAVLLVLRSMQRRREMAVRVALGSGRRHIARLLLTETALLCAAAVGVGIATTAFVLRAAAPLIEAQLGRPAPRASGIAVDGTVILIVGGVGLLAAFLLSLAPMLSAGQGLTAGLRQDERVASEGPSMRRLRSGLIAFEIAGSLVLLIGCGLMIRSVVKMIETDLGFDVHGLVKGRVALRAQNYPDATAFRQSHERIAANVAMMTGAPVAYSSWPPFFLPPTQLVETDSAGVSATAGTIAVSAGYFATFGIPIRHGREFNSGEDARHDTPVAVVSAALADRLWPDGSALGRRVRAVERTPGDVTPGPWRTVIGVAEDVRQTYEDTDRHDFYTPSTPDGRFGNFYFRTTTPAPLLVDSVRAAVAQIDPTAVVDEPRALSDLDQQLAGTRVLTALITGFALIAASLAAIGIYGVTAYAVQQRRKEVAIRIALGASNSAVVGLFLRSGARLLGAGTVAGLAGGMVVSRVLRSRIYGVDDFDITTYGAACLGLIAIGVIAIWWPVRRATIGHTATTLNAN